LGEKSRQPRREIKNIGARRVWKDMLAEGGLQLLFTGLAPKHVAEAKPRPIILKGTPHCPLYAFLPYEEIVVPMRYANSSQLQIGKVLGLRIYMHAEAIPSASLEHQDLIKRAQTFAQINRDEFNVVRVNVYAGQVSFLLYQNFFEDAFPVLQNSIAVDVQRSMQTRRSYVDSLNPPILHRKELLRPPGHPAKPEFAALTASLDGLGLFDTTSPIGFKRQWYELLANTGYFVDGHSLLPVANQLTGGTTVDSSFCPPTDFHAFTIARHLTALSRDRLSAPLRFLERFGFLNGTFSLFDYGCGKGDDLRQLGALGVPSNGWDTYYRPGDPVRSKN
jgi:hypothetical protein